jgi:signal transduction histidine kinase
MLYRILEELIKNVENHSKAKNVSVDIVFNDSILEMKVRDDGIGISVDKIDDSKSIGIIDIKERLRLYNGEVIFEGDHNKGTTVTINIPLGRITDESEKL